MSVPDWIDFDRSRAVLIGTSAYTEGLEPMPAAANSLRRMEDLLVGLCGWPSAAVISFKDLSTGDRRLREISELIEEAEDVLLLYYVGHGLLLPGDDLGLALTDTDANAALPLTTTYRLRTLREQLRYHCHARLRLIILDCCFAGIATRNAQGPGGLADRIDHASRIEGTYTWTASRASQEAVYEDGDGGLTYFTKTLHEVVASGIPGKPAWLTLEDVDRAVARRFRELPLPNTPIRPEQTRMAVGGEAGMFPFAPNRTFTDDQLQVHAGPSTAGAAAIAGHHGNGAGETLQAVQPSVLASRPQVIRLLDDAIHAALAVPGKGNQAEALAHVASAVAAFDPDRAVQLINRAEHRIRRVSSDTRDSRDRALAGITTALLTIDLGRAERLAQSITQGWRRARALTEVAIAVAAADPDRAERIARSITSEGPWWGRDEALTGVAIAVAAADPRRAERITQSVALGGGSLRRGKALAAVAAAIAGTDPDRADRITQSITSEGPWRDEAVAAVAAAFAGTDPDRAERIAESIAPGEGFWRDEALAAVAAAFAGTDPDRAERIARSITFGLWAAEALGAVAEAVRVSDPVRSRGLAVEAEGIAGSFAFSSENGEAQARFAKALAATDPYQARRYADNIRGAPSKAAEVLAEVAKVLAATNDPDEAENVARSIFDDHWKITALSEVAKVLAATDPDRAERLAYAVDDEEWLPQALAGIARVLAGSHPVGLKVRPPEF